jgi:hypothetical protein
MNDLDFKGGVIHPAARLFPAAQQEVSRKPARLILFVTVTKGYPYKINRLSQKIGEGFVTLVLSFSYASFSTNCGHLKE